MTVDRDVIRRVQAAIRATTLDRWAGMEVWPKCHKPKCRTCAVQPYRDADDFFRLVIEAAVETATTELLCRVVTDPPTDEEETP